MQKKTFAVKISIYIIPALCKLTSLLSLVNKHQYENLIYQIMKIIFNNPLFKN